MLLNKTHKHCAVAAIVMGVALATYAYDDRDLNTFMDVVRALQMVATAALFFAIFKKDALHKDKLMLFWLATTTFLEVSIAICSFNYIYEDFDMYDFGYFICSLLVLLVQWLVMAVVGFAMFIIYKEYVELTQANRAGLTLPQVANNVNPIYETKETPPPYILPAENNMTVSVQS